MTDAPRPPQHGTFSWFDLTVADAEGLRDFYAAVVGWRSQGLSMGDYDDYVMTDASGKAVAGICHARGPNAELPPVWLAYVTVPDLAESLHQVRSHGGQVLFGPKDVGTYGKMAVIRDPAGACLALMQGPA